MSQPKPDLAISDEASIGRIAKNAIERRLALDACLLQWNTEDLGTLERVDNSSPEWHGWTSRRWKSA